MRSLWPQLWPDNEHWWLGPGSRSRSSLVQDDGDRLDFKQPILRPSLRGANGSRERAPDDRLRDEAIHSSFAWRDGLLRFARNDVKFQMRLRVLAARGARGFARTVRASENRGRRECRVPNAPIASRAK